MLNFNLFVPTFLIFPLQIIAKPKQALLLADEGLPLPSSTERENENEAQDTVFAIELWQNKSAVTAKSRATSPKGAKQINDWRSTA
jgi:hypothetical protein